MMLVPLFASVASATGNFDTPLASVTIENGHEEHCIEAVTGLCAASADMSSLGAGWIDATQNNARLQVDGNDSLVTDLTRVELLPDGGIVVDVRGIVLANPAHDILVADGHNYSAPGGQYGVRWDSKDFVLWIWGPSVSQPFSGLDHREQRISGLTSEEFGGFNDTRAPTSLDDLVNSEAQIPCGRLLPGEDASCRSLVAVASAAFNSSTPTVSVGLGIDEFGLQPTPGFAGQEIGGRKGAGSIGQRSPASFVLSPLDRSAPQAPPLDRPPTSQLLRDPDRPLFRPGQDALQPSSNPPPLENDGPGLQLAVLLAAGAGLAILVATLYARITRLSEAAASPQRAAIMQHLREHGPTCVQSLASGMGVHRTTVLHHALVLQRLGEIKVIKRGMYAMLALPEHDAAPMPEPRGALRVVLEALRSAQGSMTREDLHKLLSALPLRTRNHALRQLAARGLVAEQGDRIVLVAPSG